LEALLREKCGNLNPAPFVVWRKNVPILLQKGAVEKLVKKARQVEKRFKDVFGLPLGLIEIDTTAACAGYLRAGDEQDNAVCQAILSVMEAVAQELGCFVLAVDHFGKDQNLGTRGGSSKEGSADVLLACLGEKQLNGSVINTRLAVRKQSDGPQGQEYPFTLRKVVLGKDEDDDDISTMVVDWLPPGSAQAPLPPEDPWLENCRQQDQKTSTTRFKRVLLAALAEHGRELPIPSPTPVPNSGAPLGSELGTAVGDAPVVRMVSQDVVWEAFRLCTPNDPRQTTHNQFTRARARAELAGLLAAGNIGEVTYLWLVRPEPVDEGEGL
jgi:hypothetical protein